MEKENNISNKRKPVIASGISSPRKVQRQSEISEPIFRLAFEYAATGISLASLKGRWLMVNKKLSEITGYKEEELLSMSFRDITHPDDLKKGMECFNLFLDGKIETYQVEKRYLHKNGKYVWVNLNVALVKDDHKKPVYFIAQIEDINHKKNIELVLTEIEIQEQKKITRAVLNAQEKERNRIGQELHDNVNQILAGTKLFLIVAGRGDKKLKKQLKHPIDLIDSTINEIRLLSSKNVTPLKNINLEELVGALLEDIRKTTGIKTKFNYPGVKKAISDDLKLNIYRIIQEQAGNVVKHARAKKFRVRIKTNDETININMADDGKGFDIHKKRKGIGISNMMNRVASFNGSFLIESEPGKGCIVNVTIPC